MTTTTRATSKPSRIFPLGQLVATPGVLELGVDLRPLLARHATGDWGELSDEDRDLNERALAVGARILSAYTLGEGRRVWIITEADRSATTLLLPEEY